jgi:hypothetical protein
MMDGEVPFEPERLLHDLKTLPKVSAPMDFSYHLTTALTELDSASTLPWWKRFFRPAADGGFRISSIAYGTAAVMVVMIVSVYVISVTDFQREIQRELNPEPSAIEETESTPEKLEYPNDMNARDASPSSILPSRSEERAPAIEFKEQIDAKREERPAKPASKDVPESMLKKTGERESGRSSIIPSAPALPQAKSAEQFEFRTRGILDEEQNILVRDSSISDSIRRYDSLRRLKKDSLQKTLSDPR